MCGSFWRLSAVSASKGARFEEQFTLAFERRFVAQRLRRSFGNTKGQGILSDTPETVKTRFPRMGLSTTRKKRDSTSYVPRQNIFAACEILMKISLLRDFDLSLALPDGIPLRPYFRDSNRKPSSMRRAPSRITCSNQKPKKNSCLTKSFLVMWHVLS